MSDEKIIYTDLTPEDGVIRLAKWPEGYVLWHHGEIVWRSWAKAPTTEVKVTLSVDTCEIQNLLSSISAPVASDDHHWMPISTAPKDGTTILFASKHYTGVNLGFYRDGHIWSGGFVMQPSAIPREWEDVASHWMPLPRLPRCTNTKAAGGSHASDEAR